MRLFIGGNTAVDFWKTAWSDGVDLDAASNVRSLRYAATNASQISGLACGHHWFQDGPIEVLAPNATQRSKSRLHEAHVWAGMIARGSFYEVEKDVLVSSPEFAFLQMATRLSFVDLVVLGYELTARYRIDPVDMRGFCKVEPRTTHSKLEAYVARMAGCKGAKNARRALRYIAERSASPMETALAMLLCMPRRLGGLSFQRPVLNYRIPLAGDASSMVGKGYFECDLFWPEARVAIEYDSDMFHTGGEKILQDAVRRNVLGYLGVNVITATRQQVYSENGMLGLARQLAKAIGRRGGSQWFVTAEMVELRKKLL